MLVRALCLLLIIGSNASYASLFGDDKAREQITELRQQVEALEARIAKMEETLKSQALLELYTQIETLGLELGKLRGQVEVLANANASLQKRQKDFYIDLDSRLRQIEDPDASLPTYSDPGVSLDTDIDAASSISTPAERISENGLPPQAMSIDTEQTTDTEQTLALAIPPQDLEPAGQTERQTYDAAHQLFINGDFAGAKTQFENFLNQYPQSELAPGAAYWVGNAHYALRNFQDAINAQRNLINRYPDSPKVPDALLNIASSQNEMADNKAAKKTLEELITQYPFSEAAEKAKQRLSRY